MYYFLSLTTGKHKIDARWPKSISLSWAFSQMSEIVIQELNFYKGKTSVSYDTVNYGAIFRIVRLWRLKESGTKREVLIVVSADLKHQAVNKTFFLACSFSLTSRQRLQYSDLSQRTPFSTSIAAPRKLNLSRAWISASAIAASQEKWNDVCVLFSESLQVSIHLRYLLPWSSVLSEFQKYTDQQTPDVHKMPQNITLFSSTRYQYISGPVVITGNSRKG